LSSDDAHTLRKPRSDSVRNRERLLAAAKAVFTGAGAGAPLEEIARQAGVGIGTLYRHFPTRNALIAAVYAHEVEQLVSAADALLAARAPAEALAAWFDLLIDYMDTKRVVAPVLQADPEGGSSVYAAAGPAITGAVGRLMQAARASGDIRADITDDDFNRLMIGFSHGYDRPGWAGSARRLIEVMLAGLRPN